LGARGPRAGRRRRVVGSDPAGGRLGSGDAVAEAAARPVLIGSKWTSDGCIRPGPLEGLRPDRHCPTREGLDGTLESGPRASGFPSGSRVSDSVIPGTLWIRLARRRVPSRTGDVGPARDVARDVPAPGRVPSG